MRAGVHKMLPSQSINSHTANKMLMVVNEADEVSADGEREKLGESRPGQGLLGRNEMVATHLESCFPEVQVKRLLA